MIIKTIENSNGWLEDEQSSPRGELAGLAGRLLESHGRLTLVDVIPLRTFSHRILNREGESVIILIEEHLGATIHLDTAKGIPPERKEQWLSINLETSGVFDRASGKPAAVGVLSTHLDLLKEVERSLSPQETSTPRGAY